MKNQKELAVIALGGNALLRGTQTGTIEEQEQNTLETIESLVYLIKEGYNIVITHGNGPQVGNILMRNDAGEQTYNIPQMPLDVCVADSQGGIGYMIERMLRNVMKKQGIKREVVCLFTQVVVDKNDDAFLNPTKRVGRIYNREQAKLLSKEKKWEFKEENKTKDGWRRVVPSPEPIHIVNEAIIESLAKQGNIVIAVGGGGVPVYIDKKGDIRPAEAVIDKDLASSLLAAGIGATEFYILTDVPYIYLNYGQPDQKILEFLDKKDTEKHLKNGVFSEGSMAPKIRAALNFINQGGDKSIITEATKLADKRYGSKITMEYEND
ncbi:carbamate kinase [Desulfobacula sp.]